MTGDTRDLTPEAVNAFLSELAELTKTYGLEITTCSCGGRPTLTYYGRVVRRDMHWNSDDQKYYVYRNY